MTKIIPALPNVAAPRAPYSAAVEAGGLVFISGQVGFNPDTGLPTDTADQTRLAMERLGTILDDLGMGFPDLVKTTVFLIDIEEFAVVNEVYRSFFDDDLPARSTVQVAALPRPELRVEVEAIATR